MASTYVCLWCGYRFCPRKGETDKVRQCPNCDHTDLILETEILEMAEQVKREMATTPLGAVPLVDTCRVIFWTKGLLTYRARSTLNLEAILYKMAKEGKTLDQALAEVREQQKRLGS